MKRILYALALAAGLASSCPVSAKDWPNADGSVTLGTVSEMGGAKVSTSNLFPVGGSTVTVCVSPTVTAATYSTSQNIGGLLNFASAFRTGPLSGILQAVTINSKTVLAPGLYFYPLNDNPTGSTFTDHGTTSIAAADVFKVRGAVALNTPYSGLGTHTTWQANGIGQSIVGASTSLYGVLLPQATTAALGSTTDIQICATILQD